MMKFSANLDAAMEALGAVAGVMDAIRTNVYINDVVTDSAEEIQGQFDTYMHALAASNPERYHHVYEWNMAGIPAAKLWRHELIGRGRSRTATFQFLPSKTPVPPRGPNPPGKQYYFAAKAWVMEYAIPVQLTGDPLFIWLGDEGVEKRTGESASFIFANNVRVERPGGEATGQFTQQYSFFWDNIAPRVWETVLKPKYERSVGKVAEGEIAGARVGTRARMKPLSIAYTDAHARAKAKTIAEAKRYRFDE